MGERLLQIGRPLVGAIRDHRLSTHTAAIAFRVLVALVPLTLLGVALLGLLGLEETWSDSIAPALAARLSAPVYGAADHVVREIFGSSLWPLVAAAGALLLWHLSRAVRAVSNALNEIHEAEERRSWPRLAVVTLGLSVAVSACVVAAVLFAIVAPRAVDGWAELVVSVARWPLAAAVVGVAVALLVRYAPAEQPEPRWASLGSGVIVLGWLLLSAGFGFWVTSVASYRGAVGSLAAFLVLTAYVLAVSAVFVGGAQIDELARTTRRR